MPRVVLPLLLTLSCSLFADQVVLKNGDRLSGTIEKSDDKSLVIKTEFAGEVTVQWPKENVVVIRSDQEQLAWEKQQRPGLLEGWNGGINVGFALTRGNSQTKTLDLAFDATRTGLHDKLSLYAASVYNTNDLPTASPHRYRQYEQRWSTLRS